MVRSTSSMQRLIETGIRRTFDGIYALWDGTLYCFDFEWTIAGPYEFTLARVAVEFNEYGNPEIISRVTEMDLYHLFLLRFYMYGQEPEHAGRYLRANLQNSRLREMYDIINAEEYVDKPWFQI